MMATLERRVPGFAKSIPRAFFASNSQSVEDNALLFVAFGDRCRPCAHGRTEGTQLSGPLDEPCLKQKSIA